MSGGPQQSGQTPSFEQWSSGMNFGRGEAADDARAGARVQYDQLINGGAYGSNIMGINPGYTNPDPVTINGQQWQRTGISPSQITEGRFNLSGLDPSMYQYSPEYGHLIRSDAAQGLNSQAQNISQQDKQGGLMNGIQGFFDKGGGVFALGGAGMAGALGGAFPGFDAISGASIPSGQTGILSQLGINNPFSSISDYFDTELIGADDVGGSVGTDTGVDAGNDITQKFWGDFYDQYGALDPFSVPEGAPHDLPDPFSVPEIPEIYETPPDLGGGGWSLSDLSKLRGLLGGVNGLRGLGALGGATIGGLSSWLNPTDSTQTSTSQTTNTPTVTPEAQGFLSSYLSGGQNPYLGQSTQVGTNPYAGENPYFESVLQKTLDDVRGRVNSQFGAGNAFGNSGNQELLQRTLGDVSNQARMQNYGMQQGLAEADINRRALYGSGDLTRNAALYSSDMQNKLRAAALGSMGSNTTSTITGPNPYQPSTFGNIVGGGMLGAGLLPWIFGQKV